MHNYASIFEQFFRNTSKVVVVTFYLRSRNEFKPFPAKTQAFYWLTRWVSQSEAWFLAEDDLK